MLNKSGQSVFARPVLIASATIIGILILLWTTNMISKLQDNTDEREIENFVFSLNNALEGQMLKGVGSTEKFSFAMPNRIKKVCFVDKNKPKDPFVSNELNKYMNFYPRDNLFMYPFDYELSYELNYLSLNQSPMCVEKSLGKINLDLVSFGNTTLVNPTDAEYMERECVSVYYNGYPEDNVDIVFLGDGYDNVIDFADTVNDYVGELFFSVKPFSENKNKFNFYRVDTVDELNCDVDDFIKCQEYRVKLLASNCPHDYIFVLIDRNKIMDFIKPVRSSAVSNMAKINTADKKLVLLHEFGHLFGSLADEYVDESYYRNFDSSVYPNCDSAPCTEWKDVGGTGCYKGCSVNQFFRPTDNSIMRNYFKSEEFGPVNEKSIENYIEAYK